LSARFGQNHCIRGSFFADLQESRRAGRNNRQARFNISLASLNPTEFRGSIASFGRRGFGLESVWRARRADARFGLICRKLFAHNI
jgi:hypothetical protein